MQLTARLLAAPRFRGRAADLDFGLKCSAGEACEPSRAFTPEFNSVGHCAQGAVLGDFSRAFAKNRIVMRCTLH